MRVCEPMRLGSSGVVVGKVGSTPRTSNDRSWLLFVFSIPLSLSLSRPSVHDPDGKAITIGGARAHARDRTVSRKLRVTPVSSKP